MRPNYSCCLLKEAKWNSRPAVVLFRFSVIDKWSEDSTYSKYATLTAHYCFVSLVLAQLAA